MWEYYFVMENGIFDRAVAIEEIREYCFNNWSDEEYDELFLENGSCGKIETFTDEEIADYFPDLVIDLIDELPEEEYDEDGYKDIERWFWSDIARGLR